MDEVSTENEYFSTGACSRLPVQVMLRHLGGGDRASFCGCPTPSFDQATSGCQNNGEGDPKWGSQYNLTGEMT